MLESFVDVNSLDWVKGKEFLQEVEGQITGFGEERLQWDLLLEGQRADVFSGTTRFDTVVVFHSRGAEDIENERQLVVVWAY